MTTTTLLFIGDIVGEAGLAFLEACLPVLKARFSPDIVIANAENLSPTGDQGCGLTLQNTARLFALGVHALTGGNHSWDGPDAETVYRDARVLRPLNYGLRAPGRGSFIVEADGLRLGVVNLVSRSALPAADHPLDALETRLETWESQVDAVLVDFHGESVSEKQTFAWAVDGQVAAVLGTHTHVRTMDARVLPQGTAFVTDVGMTGPANSMQGYEPAPIVEALRTRLPGHTPARIAAGDVELGAVLITLEAGRTLAIERLTCTVGDRYAVPL